jgi:hypothetical protein
MSSLHLVATVRHLTGRYQRVKQRFRTYTAYSIGCALAWAIILIIVGATDGKHNSHTILLVFAGWAIGWTSATIARSVYPPPRSRGASNKLPRG